MAGERIYTVSDTILNKEKDLLLRDEILNSKYYGLLKSWIDQYLMYGVFNDLSPLISSLKSLNEKTTKKIGYSKGQVSKNMLELKGIGVIEETKTAGSKPGKIARKIELTTLEPLLINILNNPDQNSKRPLGRLTKESKQKANSFLEKNYSLLSEPENTTPVILKLLQHLCSVLPSEKGIFESDTEIVKDDSKINIKALCPQVADNNNIHLMKASDTRVINVLQGMLRNELQSSIEVTEQNVFCYDAHSLAKEAGFGSDLAALHNAMTRISMTVFIIDKIKGEKFDDMIQTVEGTKHFRFFTEYDEISLSEEDLFDLPEKEKTNVKRLMKRKYQIRFHSDVINAVKLFGSLSFIGHPGLKHYGNDYPHLIYFWCKAKIGTSRKRDRSIADPWAFTFHDLNKQVHSTALLSNFEASYLQVAQRFHKHHNHGKTFILEPGKTVEVNILGYIHKFIYDEEYYQYLFKLRKHRRQLKKKIVIEIYRDPNDPYVGDNSQAAKARRNQEIKERKKAQLLLEEQDSELSERPIQGELID